MAINAFQSSLLNIGLVTHLALPPLLAKELIPFAASLNQPDEKKPTQTTFGTIDELIPLLQVMRVLVIEGKLETINLYGFSAGGGAVINALAVLNSNRYSRELENISIGSLQREKILVMVKLTEHK